MLTFYALCTRTAHETSQYAAVRGLDRDVSLSHDFRPGCVIPDYSRLTIIYMSVLIISLIDERTERSVR